MGQKVISFRVDDDAINELEKQKLQDESIMLTAQRVLRQALGLGLAGEQARRIEEIINSYVSPINEQLTIISERLDMLETKTLETIQLDSNPSEPTRVDKNELITKLSELLNNESYPLNSGGRLKKRLSVIISELMAS